LLAAGVQDGDLLVATEGSATTISIRCDADCRVQRVAEGARVAHAEGHITLVPSQPGQQLPETHQLGQPRSLRMMLLVVLGLVAVGLAVIGALGLRARVRTVRH
jgi:hypothetical protein